MTETDIITAQALLAKRQTLKSLLITLQALPSADIQILSAGTILARVDGVSSFALTNYINSYLVDLKAQLGTLGVTNLTD